ncbi:MAG: hypothetical protein GOV15_00130 [Candidatus Diapherotrites archaeon]|nr:hypothetical protein [Candidatus Diapherotrites archaeon]
MTKSKTGKGKTTSQRGKAKKRKTTVNVLRTQHTQGKQGKMTEHSKHEIRGPIGSIGREQYKTMKASQNQREFIGIRRMLKRMVTLRKEKPAEEKKSEKK